MQSDCRAWLYLPCSAAHSLQCWLRTSGSGPPVLGFPLLLQSQARWLSPVWGRVARSVSHAWAWGGRGNWAPHMRGPAALLPVAAGTVGLQ